jgi:ceramide glucosyltransferase
VSTATWFVALSCAASHGCYVLAWLLVVGWWLRHRPWRSGVVPPHGGTGVSILKPLCGIEDDLERNLASFFALDHRPLQLVFGAEDPTDPALELARRLSRRHRDHDVAIVVGTTSSATSPKVAVLEALLPHARHGVILLSDSNVRVSTDEVGRVLPAFADPRVGMVHQPAVGIGEETAAAAIENLHYGELAGFLSTALTVATGQHAVNAKGQWVRRSALAEVDDFAGVRDSGADDYALSRLVATAGWKLRLAPVPVRTVHRSWSWRALAQRHLRHSGLRRRLCPAAYPLELLLNPIPWSVALAATEWAPLVPALVGLKVALEVSAARLLRGTPLAWRHAALIPLKDLGYFVGWFASFAIRVVSWRGRRYVIGPGAVLVAAAEPQPAALPRRARSAL